MMNRFVPIVVFVSTLVAACTLSGSDSTPTQAATASVTVLDTPTLSFTETPTPTPETAEQKIHRIAVQAISLGWNPNDETTWTIPGETSNASELQYYKDIDGDPNSKSDLQLDERDAFLAELWKARFGQLLQDQGRRAPVMDILEQYLRSGFHPKVMTAEQLDEMSLEEIQELIQNLTAYEMEDLVMFQCASNQEALKPLYGRLFTTVEEMNKRVITDDKKIPEANILFRPTYKNGQLIGALYGIWENSSSLDRIQWADSYSYRIMLLGRQSFHRKSVIWRGDLAAEAAWVDLGAVLQLPYDRTGIRGILKDNQETILHFNFIVVTDTDTPIAFRPEDLGFQEKDVKSGEFDRSLRTREMDGTDWFPSYTWLTSERLFNSLGYPFTLMRIRTPNEHVALTDGKVKVLSMFFDPLTGLPVIGNSGDVKETLKTGGTSIQFYVFKNPWP